MSTTVICPTCHRTIPVPAVSAREPILCETCGASIPTVTTLPLARRVAPAPPARGLAGMAPLIALIERAGARLAPPPPPMLPTQRDEMPTAEPVEDIPTITAIPTAKPLAPLLTEEQDRPSPKARPRPEHRAARWKDDEEDIEEDVEDSRPELKRERTSPMPMGLFIGIGVGAFLVISLTLYFLFQPSRPTSGKPKAGGEPPAEPGLEFNLPKLNPGPG